MRKINLSLLAFVLSTSQIASAQMACKDLFKATRTLVAAEAKPAGLTVKEIKEVTDLILALDYYDSISVRKNLKSLEQKISEYDLSSNPELISSLFFHGIRTYDNSYSTAKVDAGLLLKKLTDSYPQFDFLKPKKLLAKNPKALESLEEYVKDYFNIDSVMSTGLVLHPDIFYRLVIQQAKRDRIKDPITLTNMIMPFANYPREGTPEQNFILPAYNAFKALKAIIKEKMEGRKKTYQEVILVQGHSESTFHFVAISNRPIEGYTEQRYGIYLKNLRMVQSKDNYINEIFTWKVNGKDLSAHLYFKRGEKVNVKIDTSAKPKYDLMVQDRKLSGAILISKNMEDYVPVLFANYNNYLKKSGFKSEVQSLSGTESFNKLMDLSRSGEIDYVIREGHAESGNENLITMPEEVTVHKYTKKNETHEEVIYLYTPKSDLSIETGMNFSDFGAALRDRPNKQSPVIYYDSACYSDCRMTQSIRYIADNAILPIGSSSFTDTFTPTKGNAGFEVIEGIRNQLSFDQIRQNIERPYGELVKNHEKLVFPDKLGSAVKAKDLKDIDILDVKIKRNFSEEVP